MFGFGAQKTVSEKLKQGLSEFSKKRYTYGQYNEAEHYKSMEWDRAASWAKQEIDKGKPVRDVLVTIFCGQLLNCMLSAFGERRSSRKEWGLYNDWSGCRPCDAPPPPGLVSLDRYVDQLEQSRNMFVDTHIIINESLRKENDELKVKIKELEARLAR